MRIQRTKYQVKKSEKRCPTALNSNRKSAKRRAGVSSASSTRVNESILWRVLHDVKLGLSLRQVRRELEYLQDLGLAKLEDVETETPSAKLTAHGVDVVEYTVDSPPGIARPKKY